MNASEERALLEAAARSAGMKPFHAWGKVFIDGSSLPPKADWNPLTDDGDALRLAARMHLWEAIRFAHRYVSADVDIYAATRLAITRAAAQMDPGRRA